MSLATWCRTLAQDYRERTDRAVQWQWLTSNTPRGICRVLEVEGLRDVFEPLEAAIKELPDFYPELEEGGNGFKFPVRSTDGDGFLARAEWLEQFANTLENK